MQSPSPLKVRKTANEVVYTPRRRNEAIVQIPVSSRKAVPTNELRGSSIDLIERIERITISGAASAPASQEATSSLGKLLNSCSSDDIHPFSAFLTSPSFSSLVSPNSRSGPTSQKLGEASYSEVFGFGTAFDAPEVVVKVIPLITEALYRPGGPDEVKLPDCSEPEDVLREIMITKKMAGLPGGGFVDFLG